MWRKGGSWSIVLAAGEGMRLRALARDERGRPVPKQFCSLEGGRTLFERALERAEGVCGAGRVLAVVAAKHSDRWEPLLEDFPQRNVIVQPENRGTAAGLLLPLLAVLERDPDARVAVLPSDHHAEQEEILRTALLDAMHPASSSADEIVLLGVEPDDADSDYGWVVPRPGRGRLRGIERFVEKPERAVSRRLHSRGALWNTFLLAASGRALLELFERQLPGLVAAFRRAGPIDGAPPATLEDLYEELDTHDFSRDVLQGSERRLRVLQVPPCGWTDLGTPERVAGCLRRREPQAPLPARLPAGTPVLARLLERSPERTEPDEDRPDDPPDRPTARPADPRRIPGRLRPLRGRWEPPTDRPRPTARPAQLGRDSRGEPSRLPRLASEPPSIPEAHPPRPPFTDPPPCIWYG